MLGAHVGALPNLQRVAGSSELKETEGEKRLSRDPRRSWWHANPNWTNRTGIDRIPDAKKASFATYGKRAHVTSGLHPHAHLARRRDHDDDDAFVAPRFLAMDCLLRIFSCRRLSGSSQAHQAGRPSNRDRVSLEGWSW